MKLLKTLIAAAIACALVAGSALAEQGKCCKTASDKGETCSHKCCVASAKDGKECEKCGGKGEIKKKAGEKKGEAKKEEKKAN